jgi:hypothetical protein
MTAEKSKEAAPKKPVPEKVVEAKAEVAPKTVEAKAETSITESKLDAAPKRQGMGEGQKPVSKAYKDNWSDIFGKKKKR